MVSADIKSITMYGHQDCETWIGASLVHINVFCNMAKYVCGFVLLQAGRTIIIPLDEIWNVSICLLRYETAQK